MSGFYAYQTFDLQHLQNDCLLFGAGVDYVFKKITITQSIGGYNGYLNIGDKPLVYRAAIRFKNKMFDYKLSYERGLHDYDFQKIGVGVTWHTR